MLTQSGTVDLEEVERSEMLSRIATFLKVNSEQGYRLLLVGGKYVDEQKFAEWRVELNKAKKAMKQRDEVGVGRVCVEYPFVHPYMVITVRLLRLPSTPSNRI